MISSLSAWIMSIAGIICLSVLVELVLPNGQMNKYIKGIFSFIIILVIISPIPALVGKNFSLDDMFDNGKIEVQENYLYQVNVDKLDEMKNHIESQIQECGYQNVVISIDSDVFATRIEISAVYVDLSRLIISENAAHKDMIAIQKDILEIVTSIVKIKNERVVFL